VNGKGSVTEIDSQIYCSEMEGNSQS